MDDRGRERGRVFLGSYLVARHVLRHGSMFRTALALVLVAATASAASAGSYLGLGIGTAPATSTSTDLMATEADGRSGRLLLGIRLARLSLEGSVGRFDLVVNNQHDFKNTMLGAGLKYNLPLGDNFEAFGRGGVQRTYLNEVMADRYDVAGNGYYLGGGVEYRVEFLLGGSIFLDYQYATATVDSETLWSFDVSNRMWTIGLTLSL